MYATIQRGRGREPLLKAREGGSGGRRPLARTAVLGFNAQRPCLRVASNLDQYAGCSFISYIGGGNRFHLMPGKGRPGTRERRSNQIAASRIPS